MDDKKAEQALNTLYLAARRAALSADEHETVKQAAIVLQETLSPKKEDKKK